MARSTRPNPNDPAQAGLAEPDDRSLIAIAEDAVRAAARFEERTDIDYPVAAAALAGLLLEEFPVRLDAGPTVDGQG